MRKNLKTLLICLLMIVCVTSLFLVSCVKPQPEDKTFTVTLMVDGANWKQEKVNEGETYTPATPTKTDMNSAVGTQLKISAVKQSPY